jgi:hypothetical protein
MINKLEVSSTAQMPEDKFWELVEMAHWPCDYNKMKIKYLKAMDRDECKRFRHTFSKAYCLLDSVATKLEDLPCGDDSYGDLLHHIIGLGRELFYDYCNDPSMIKALADSYGYKESYSYCIPYDSDYSDDGQYSLKAIIRNTKKSIEEIKKFRKMDIGDHWNQDNWKNLEPIGEEIDKINNLMVQFLKDPTESGLKELIKQKNFVNKASKKIEKFFHDNYLELPRKFTEGNGFSTALITNAVADAENVLEFIKG